MGSTHETDGARPPGTDSPLSYTPAEFRNIQSPPPLIGQTAHSRRGSDDNRGDMESTKPRRSQRLKDHAQPTGRLGATVRTSGGNPAESALRQVQNNRSRSAAEVAQPAAELASRTRTRNQVGSQPQGTQGTCLTRAQIPRPDQSSRRNPPRRQHETVVEDLPLDHDDNMSDTQAQQRDDLSLPHPGGAVTKSSGRTHE